MNGLKMRHQRTVGHLGNGEKAEMLKPGHMERGPHCQIHCSGIISGVNALCVLRRLKPQGPELRSPRQQPSPQ